MANKDSQITCLLIVIEVRINGQKLLQDYIGLLVFRIACAYRAAGVLVHTEVFLMIFQLPTRAKTLTHACSEALACSVEHRDPLIK